MLPGGWPCNALEPIVTAVFQPAISGIKSMTDAVSRLLTNTCESQEQNSIDQISRIAV